MSLENKTGREKKRMYVSIRFKMLIGFTVLFTIVFAVAYYWFLTMSTNLALENIEREMGAIAERTAAHIDGDVHQALYEDAEVPDGPDKDKDPEDPRLEEKYWGIEDERYRELADWLAFVKASQGTVTNPDGTVDSRIFVYTYTATGEPGVVDFVGSAGAINDPPSGATFRKRYEPQSQEMLDGLTKTSINLTTPVRDQWGIWFSGFTPIYSSEGEIVGAVGIDMRDTTIVALQNKIRATIIPAFLVTFAALFAAVFLISYGISRPIIGLTQAAEKVAEGDYGDDVLPQQTSTIRDETSTLTDVFGLMVDKVRTREERLKREVAKLQIMVDQTKRDQQVSEIVESDFFQDLQAKARRMRSRSKSGRWETKKEGKNKSQDTESS